MALSFVKYTGDGVQTQWTVTAPYIAKSHISVLVEGAPVTFVWVNNTLIQTTVAALDLDIVEVRRDTPINAPLVDFEDGGTLAEPDLDLIALQHLYLAQEQADDIARSMNLAFDEEWDALGKPMKNLADPAVPTALTDAINIGFLNTALVGSGNVPVPLDPSEDGMALIAGSGLWAWAAMLVENLSDVVADLKTFLTSATLSDARTNLGLGSAAVLNDGIGAGDLPLNSDLGSASLVDTGTASGEIPLLDGVGMPSVSGNQMTFDNMINAMNWNKGNNIASAATTDIGAATGNFVDIAGVVTITALGTAPAGSMRWCRFLGVLTLTHNAVSMILLGGADILTVANDIVQFVSLGSGNWQMVDYVRGSGTSLAQTAFRGALVNKTANQSTVNDATTVITFDAETYDTTDIHDNSINNDRLTVPTGVTKVRLTAVCTWASSSIGFRECFIAKNGSNAEYKGRGYAMVEANETSGGVNGVNIAGSVIEVIAGDYFQLRARQNATTLDVTAANTWFAMEIIE